MYLQLPIIIVLYITGALFLALFYPRLSLNYIAVLGLYFGGLFNTLFGIILGLAGCFSELIWFIYGFVILVLLLLHYLGRKRWTNVSWGSILAPFSFMFILFMIEYLFLGHDFNILTSSASLPYIIDASHVYNYKTITLAGAGYDFRSQYGISEILIHALAQFFDLPALSLWHPFLWISQYAFFFMIVVEHSKEMAHDKRSRIYSLIIGVLILIWTATIPMNWMQSFYIHVHLFSSFSFLIFVYFFWKQVVTNKKQNIFILLSSLAICGYGLSRVESPMMILILIAIALIAYKFSVAEYRLFFYPQIILMICWLFFLLIGYQGTSTPFWSDSHLIMAIVSYIFLLILLIINGSFNIIGKINFNWISEHLFIFYLFGSLLLAILNFGKFVETIQSILNIMFGKLDGIGLCPWDMYWIVVTILTILLLAKNKPWAEKRETNNGYFFWRNTIISYILLIIILGFFRVEPYEGSRWGDSASRMLTHVSPLVSLLLFLKIADGLPPGEKIRQNKK